MFTLTLLPRVAVSSLLALKISCGAGENSDASVTTDTAASSTTGPVIETTPTSTEDPGSVTEIGSTGPATGSTGLTGTGTGAPSTGEGTFGESTAGESTGESSGGGMLPDGQCRSDADCDPDSFEQCHSADDPQCGPCQIDQEECVVDRDCGEALCEEVAVDCGCNGPTDHVCVPVCTGPADCAEGLACDIETGHCEAVSCSEGPACPPLFDCVPESGGDDCVRHPCRADTDCEDGVCVEQRCFADYGLCMPPGV